MGLTNLLHYAMANPGILKKTFLRTMTVIFSIETISHFEDKHLLQMIFWLCGSSKLAVLKAPVILFFPS